MAGALSRQTAIAPSGPLAAMASDSMLISFGGTAAATVQGFVRPWVVGRLGRALSVP